MRVTHITLNKAFGIKPEDVLSSKELALVFFSLGTVKSLMHSTFECAFIELTGPLLLVY